VAEVVARDERNRERSHSLVGDGCPGGPAKYEGMAAVSRVACCDDVSGALPPGAKDALDRLGSEIRAVREADDRRLRFCGERGEPAPKRDPRAALPVAALDEASAARVELVCPGHDDHVVHRRLTEAGQHLGEEQALLRRAETACGSGGQDNPGDHSDVVVTARMSARWTRRKV
jgi:hypothetical protein